MERLFKTVAAPRPAARTRVQQTATSSSTSAMYTIHVHNTQLIQVRSRCPGKVNGVHASEQVFGLAWWTLDKATRSRTHASLRPASEQVSSRSRTCWRNGLWALSCFTCGNVATPKQSLSYTDCSPLTSTQTFTTSFRCWTVK